MRSLSNRAVAALMRGRSHPTRSARGGRVACGPPKAGQEARPYGAPSGSPASRFRPSARRLAAHSAVIFDMDGLMLDTEMLGQRAWEVVAASHRDGFDLALCREMIGRNYSDCVALLASHYGSSEHAASLMRAWVESYDSISAEEAIAIKSGLIELLDFLESQRIPKAVATSTRRERAEVKLARANLLQRFDVLVGGDEVARGKPAPDIFIVAAARLGVAPAACIVLEDSEPGVIAAFAAGMTPIMVPDLHPPSEALLARAPTVLPSLHEVARHLASRGTRQEPTATRVR